MFSLFDEIEESEEISEQVVSAGALREVREAGLAVVPKRTAKQIEKIITASIDYRDAETEKDEIRAMNVIQDAALKIAEGE